MCIRDRQWAEALDQCAQTDQLLEQVPFWEKIIDQEAVSYTHLTLPTNNYWCRSRWWPDH
ncbi:hypothetical protein H8944_18545 [Bacillus pumilus]|uniref:hypothetical protein n=1 Tax=Bacillus pumilus TaxID=1408 RepID=UPI00164BAF2F|nr:hypothetical protein [Bacillus pumilus]MBC5974100.1 hypothetical protein [Bacillus pumilus]